MYWKHNNKTAVRSQQLIAAALLRLLQYKALPQITIVEICEEAGVGRKTFYRNFEVKEDVVDFLLDGLCEEFEQEIQGKTADERLAHYFSFSKKHIDLFQTMYQQGLMPTMQSRFARLLPVTMPLWSEDPVEQAYYSRFASAGVQAIMQLWVERSFQEEMEQVVSLARRVQEQKPL